MALLEAQAAGLPVVAGASPGVAEIVRSGETGRLVPVGEPHAFAEALAEMIENPEVRRRFGAQAREITRREHDLDPAARPLDDILREARHDGR